MFFNSQVFLFFKHRNKLQTYKIKNKMLYDKNKALPTRFHFFILFIYIIDCHGHRLYLYLFIILIIYLKNEDTFMLYFCIFKIKVTKETRLNFKKNLAKMQTLDFDLLVNSIMVQKIY